MRPKQAVDYYQVRPGANHLRVQSHADSWRKCCHLPGRRQILLELAGGADYHCRGNGMNLRDHSIQSSDLRWPINCSATPPGQGTVQLWCTMLHRDKPTPADVLSAEERQRAARFRIEPLRQRFVVSRIVLRTVLGQCLGVTPAQVAFTTDARGKPHLTGNGSLEFNLAHSGDLMMLAVSRALPVGVDVERLRSMNDSQGIARRFFTPREADWLEHQENHQRDHAFFQLWTRKEAILKATGEGISSGLDSLELLDADGRFVDVVKRNVGRANPRTAQRSSEECRGEGAGGTPASPSCSEKTGWTLTELEPATGFVGALALPANAGGVQLQKAAFCPA